MKHHAARWLAPFLAILAFSFLASPKAAAADDDDPPTRAARLSYTTGAVSFEPAGTDEWVDAVTNRPMTTGDKLWTDQDSRAELRIDSYAVRLGPQTGFSFLNLDDRTVQIRLTEGTLSVRVRRFDDDQALEIDTPNLAFNILRSGLYRIDVNENGDTTVVGVREGQGEVTGGGSAYPIHAGDSVTFSGLDELSVDTEGYPEDDDFDRWNRDRDHRWDHSTSSRYVSDDVVGYEDLDDNGGWRPVPEYGNVWFPHTTVVGWAPYRYGHWVWISPWGWTWVDEEPWGYAPFHYGRWVIVGGVWGWVPVPPRPAVVTVAYVRPVYAPALVAFVGGGAGVGVAWFPLGPRDVYCPSYHVSERYVERVNVSNTVIVNRTQVTNVYNNVYVNKTTNVTNITYQNQRESNAVTATTQAAFTGAQPVARNMAKVDAQQIAAAPVSPLAPAVAPQQRSFAGAGARAKAVPPAQVTSRQVVAKATPPPPPVPVARQLQAVQANGGRPVAVSQVREAQAENTRANVRVAAPAKPVALPPQGQKIVARPAQPGTPQNQNQAAEPNANRPPNANPNRPPNANANANTNTNTNTNTNANNPAVSNPPNNNRANANQQNNPANRPPSANVNSNNPPPASPPNTNRANAGQNNNPNRPPAAQAPQADPKVEQRHQQELDRLRQQQDQERQKVEQQQVQQQRRLEQQKADEQRQQQIQRQQQQQLDQLERKHDQQQQRLEQNQQRDVQRPARPQEEKPQKNDKPPKNEKDKDKPPH